MEIEIPTWLTTDFIKLALTDQSTNTNEITITNIDMRRAVPKGNNYMCDIFRVKVFYHKKYESLENLLNNGTVQEISIIVKSPITGGLNELLFSFGLIQKEVLMYKEYLPRLQRILNEDEDIFAKLFHSNAENVLVLEDLNFLGYKMVNRLDQLDYKHCKIALKTLALFHAASVKIAEENPEIIKTVGKELFFDRAQKAKNEFLTSSQIDLVVIEMSAWPELNGYMGTIEKLRDKIWDLLVDCFECEEGEFSVLNHGDFWITNMLFKYDQSNEPSNIKFIDLQVTRHTTPAIDLIYFMHGSVQEDIRLEKYDELISIYLEALNENLERFQCVRQKLDERELRKSLKKREFYEFYTNITLVPVVLNDTNNIFEIKDMTEKHIKENVANNPFRKYYQGKKYKDVFTGRVTNEFSKHKWFTDIIKDNLNHSS